MPNFELVIFNRGWFVFSACFSVEYLPRNAAAEVQISLWKRDFNIVFGKRLPNHKTEVALNR